MDILQIALLGGGGNAPGHPVQGRKNRIRDIYLRRHQPSHLFAVLDRIAAVVARLDEITAYIDLAPAYIEMLLKMLGITFVAEFSSALCRDAGYQTIAQQIEVFAKLAVLVLGLPVVFSLLELIGEFLS